MVIKHSNHALSIPKEDLIIKLAFTLNESLSYRKEGGGGEGVGLGPRNDVLTTCKAVTLRSGQS